MFRKSKNQKRLEYISKLMANGYKYALIEDDGKINHVYRYKYETKKPQRETLKLVSLKELFYSIFETCN